MQTIQAKHTIDHASAVETPSLILETKSAVISKTAIKKRQERKHQTNSGQANGF